MQIHKLPNYPTQQVERTGFRHHASQPNQAEAAKLSDDEQRMIKKEFTGAANRILKLYVANGEVKNEQPSAKGKNIDFTV